MTDRPEDLIPQRIRDLSAYHVQPAEGLVKLDAMENPYTMPVEIRAGWLERMNQLALNRYPSPSSPELLELLRDTQAIPDDAEVILGNGSDELIQLLCMIVAGSGRDLLTVEPGFVMFRQAAVATGLGYRAVPLMPDFSLDMAALRQAIDQHNPALVFLACPNNPTGNLWPEEQLLDVVEACSGLVVIDEAYAPFASHSMLGHVGQYPNLLLMRTLSKFGLAGCRLGYLVGPAEWIDECDKVRMPYNVNSMTQETVIWALQHHELYRKQTQTICAQREQLHQRLAEMAGVEPFDSEANFILFRVAAGQAGVIFDALKSRGVLIKNLDSPGGLLHDCLRVTVGSDDENTHFLQALEAVLSR